MGAPEIASLSKVPLEEEFHTFYRCCHASFLRETGRQDRVLSA
jgi:hypothetical protein